MSEKKTGICPGTFDPITLGHIDIIGRGARMVDRLVVAVARQSEKDTLFSIEQRVEMIERDCDSLLNSDSEIIVEPFSGLLIDFARQHDSHLIIRGLRAVSDFEMEFQMAMANARLSQEVEVVFLMASERSQFISSRIVKEIAQLGGDISTFVGQNAKTALIDAYAE